MVKVQPKHHLTDGARTVHRARSIRIRPSVGVAVGITTLIVDEVAHLVVVVVGTVAEVGLVLQVSMGRGVAVTNTVEVEVEVQAGPVVRQWGQQ